MTKLTNEDLKTKAAVLNALTSAFEYLEMDIADEVEISMNKLAKELSKDINGLRI
jgi:hypothetical protein